VKENVVRIRFLIVVVLTPESSRDMLADTLASLKLQQPLTCSFECLVLVPEPKNLFSWVSMIEADLNLKYIEYQPTKLGEGINQAISDSQAMPNDWIFVVKSGDLLLENAFSAIHAFLKSKPSCYVLAVDESQKEDGAESLVCCHKPEWSPDWLWDNSYMQRGVLFQFGFLDSLNKFSISTEITTLEILFQELLLRAEVDARFEMKLIVSRMPQVVLISIKDESALGDELPEKLLLNFAKSCDSKASIKRRVEGGLKVHWSLSEKLPKVSLIIPTRDGLSVLKPCVDAIRRLTTYSNFELIIIDNNSVCSKTLSYMEDVEKTDDRVRVINWNHCFNYSAINNFGVSHSSGEIIGLINNDIEPINGDWLTEMVRQVSRKEIGCVGAKLYYPNDTIQHAGVILGLGGVAGHGHKRFPREHPGYCQRLRHVQNYSAVTAACLLVRKDVYNEVGGLNERFLKVTYNDVDLCLKIMKAGYRNLWTPDAELYHHESISRGKNNTWRKKYRAKIEFNYMRIKWSSLLDNDPAYNPNLTLVHEDFSLR